MENLFIFGDLVIGGNRLPSKMKTYRRFKSYNSDEFQKELVKTNWNNIYTTVEAEKEIQINDYKI